MQQVKQQLTDALKPTPELMKDVTTNPNLLQGTRASLACCTCNLPSPTQTNSPQNVHRAATIVTTALPRGRV
jgi:hypothetical protein